MLCNLIWPILFPYFRTGFPTSVSPSDHQLPLQFIVFGLLKYFSWSLSPVTSLHTNKHNQTSDDSSPSKLEFGMHFLSKENWLGIVEIMQLILYFWAHRLKRLLRTLESKLPLLWFHREMFSKFQKKYLR